MILMDPADLQDQAGMYRAFARYFQDVQTLCPGSLNAMLDASISCCSYSKRQIILQAETKPWMANPGGILHGGITSAYLDLSMGLICRYFSGGRMTRTIHADVNYLRAVPIGTRICIRASLTKPGSGVCFTEGAIWADGSPQRLLATANGAYSVDRAESTSKSSSHQEAGSASALG